MGYIKLVKNKAFYKRYVVKWRRRRNNQTNYRLRRRLITQDKRKYSVPKWRLVVRITNRDIIAQVTSAKMIGDSVLCCAYSHELKRYGLKLGLTNFAACYATGLLLARRLLQKLKLDKYYPGKKHIDGNRFQSTLENVKWKPDDKICRPFKCILDKGLSRRTSGARVFAVMKGAIDGGLNIPHKVNRFPGFSKGKKEEEKDTFDPQQLADRIYGQHVSKYMSFLKEKDPDKFQRHFSQYIKEGIEPEQIRVMYEKVHKAIRKDPSAPPKTKKDWKQMNVRLPLPKWTKEQKLKQKLERLELRKQQEQPKKEEIKVDS